MKNVERIIILFPGEITSELINNPANYSLSRLLIELHRRAEVPIHILNQSARHEQYGNIEFIHLTRSNCLRLLARFAFRRNALIVSQTGAHHKYASLLRAAMPGSRVLVRLGGVYFGKDYLESEAFQSTRRAHRRRLSVADMIISTADGTPVDLYMEKVGIAPDRYKKWLNGFPVIVNGGQHKRANRIVCISRLHQEKGLDYVVRSFALALPQLTEPHILAIVGDGPEMENLQMLARELGVDAHIEFTGHSYEIDRHLYSCKLLVSGLANNPVMEAIATGTPVVTPDLGEMKVLYGRFPNVHVVDYPVGGYGPIPAAHMGALVRRTADAIVEVLNNYPCLDGADRRVAHDLFSWEQRLEDELDLYENLLAPVGFRSSLLGQVSRP